MSLDEALFNPGDFIRYVARCRGVDEEAFQIPNRIILLYSNETFEYAKKTLNAKLTDWLHGQSRPVLVGIENSKEIGVIRAWVGAPAAVVMLEELIFCGAKSIFEVGLAGGLQPSSKPGEIVVVTEAIRDEGTSNHYLSPDVRLESSPRLRNLLTEQLTSEGIKPQIGPVWTTDGAFRETRGKFQKFSDLGVLGVNMETSALLAVAKYRSIEIASAQVISDVLSNKGWLPAFEDEEVLKSLQTLLRPTIKVLSSI